mgnify:CR=1 FL=1|jgi:acetolactate synthase-1/3 small subunit
MHHIISVLVENKFGVLARIAGLFSGRGFNIDTLNVAPTHTNGRSRITATLNGDEKALDQCIKQLDKLVDVIAVENYHGEEAVGRELVLLKVEADSKTRPEITQICDVFRGKIIDVSPNNLIIEVTGNKNKIKAFLDLLESFGVSELARTGVVSLRRGASEN